MAARLLIPLLLVLLVGSQVTLASVVQETCAKVEKVAGRKELDAFCVTMFQAAPESATADEHGLAVIATNLTLANYTAAVAMIKDLQRRGGWTDGQQAALATCRERYIEAVNVVHIAIHAQATGQKQAYKDDTLAIIRAADDCDHAFASVSGESPLRKVNANAADVTVVAMLMVYLGF